MMESNQTSVATVKVKTERKITWMWLIPLLALIVALWLGYQKLSQVGQTVEIHFSDAQGLVEGRTKIRYQGLEIGVIKKVSLDAEEHDIYVEANISPKATYLLSENTRFWLVKPQANLNGVIGLDALVSGNYVAVEPNLAEINDPEANQDFKMIYTALDQPPPNLNAYNGLPLILTAQELDSISIGSKILYRKIPIGEVTDFNLDEQSDQVKINVIIDKKYAHIINSESRFWNVSGVNSNIGFNGIDIQLESLSSLLSGGIAVDSPENGKPDIEPNTSFTLYPDIRKAGRGIPIELTLPDKSQLSVDSPIMYKGIEVGQITKIGLSDNKKNVTAIASIQPAFSDNLNEGTQFRLEEAKISLTDVDNVSNLIKGNFVTMLPGIGEAKRSFNVVRQISANSSNSDQMIVTLTSEDNYGMEVGRTIQYKGFPVGQIASIDLKDHKVIFTLLIDNKYKDLIKSNNRFFVNGMIEAEMNPSTGLTVSFPPFKQILARSISFDSSGTDQARESYPLYRNQALANIARYENSGSTNYTLFAKKLPSVTKGSPILYKNLQVGQVDSFSLVDDGLKIIVRIDNQYKHLITNNTVFWNNSGFKIKAGLTGIDVTASPLSSLINGGIAFDNIVGVENKTNKMWVLYDDYKTAREYGRTIYLTIKHNDTIKEGMPIKYQGVNVGEITSVKPNFFNKNVDIQARIFPEYSSYITVKGSQFWVVTSEITLSGTKNINALFSPYLQVEPGNQTTKHYHFTLDNQASDYSAGVVFYLQSHTKHSLKIGAPVLYREFEVGKVIDISLSNMANYVITTISIEPKYAYLIRDNTVFWNTSGLNADIGFSGVNVKTGTVESLLRGGISFSTPDSKKLQPRAPAKKTFKLNDEADSDWAEWQLAIPHP